mgnify:CR=1 FL=1
MHHGLGGHEFVPDYEVPPGATLRETLDGLEMSQAEFARRTDLSAKHVNQIIQGEAPISVDIARRLELVTEVPAALWLGLDANYQAAKLRQTLATTMTADDVDWVREMPVRALIQRGFIPDTADTASRFEGLLRFFGVANRRAWESLWAAPDAAFHRSMAFTQKPFPTATLLRLVEIEAAEVATLPFDRAAFREAAREIRSWLREPIGRPLITKIRSRLASVGVAFVVVPEVEGSRASGATRWLSADKVLIALSMRYKRDDRFWFTFFHEIGHILLHGKRTTFVDEERGEVAAPRGGDEAEADRFASDVLIPRQLESQVRKLTTSGEIEAFAERLGLPPGVVVGRLQRLEVIGWQTPLNRLRKQINREELQSAANRAKS